MTLTINGEKTDIRDNLTVERLLSHLNIEPARVAVEVNLSIIKKIDFHDLMKTENLNHELLDFEWKEKNSLFVYNACLPHKPIGDYVKAMHLYAAMRRSSTANWAQKQLIFLFPGEKLKEFPRKEIPEEYSGTIFEDNSPVTRNLKPGMTSIKKILSNPYA